MDKQRYNRLQTLKQQPHTTKNKEKGEFLFGQEIILEKQKLSRMRVDQQMYAYKNYDRNVKSKKLVQLLNRRNVLNMQDQIKSQKELQKYLNETQKLNVYLNKNQRESINKEWSSQVDNLIGAEKSQPDIYGTFLMPFNGTIEQTSRDNHYESYGKMLINEPSEKSLPNTFNPETNNPSRTNLQAKYSGLRESILAQSKHQHTKNAFVPILSHKFSNNNVASPPILGRIKSSTTEGTTRKKQFIKNKTQQIKNNFGVQTHNDKEQQSSSQDSDQQEQRSPDSNPSEISPQMYGIRTSQNPDLDFKQLPRKNFQQDTMSPVSSKKAAFQLETQSDIKTFDYITKMQESEKLMGLTTQQIFTIDSQVEQLLQGRGDLNSPQLKGAQEIFKSFTDPDDLNKMLKSRLILNQIEINKIADKNQIDTQQMVQNLSKKELQQEKILLQGIADLLGKTDRQYRPYSKNTNKFKQKLQMNMKSELNQKILKYNEQVKKHSDLQQIIDQGINPAKLDSATLWKLSQMVVKQKQDYQKEIAQNSAINQEINDEIPTIRIPVATEELSPSKSARQFNSHQNLINLRNQSARHSHFIGNFSKRSSKDLLINGEEKRIVLLQPPQKIQKESYFISPLSTHRIDEMYQILCDATTGTINVEQTPKESIPIQSINNFAAISVTANVKIITPSESSLKPSIKPKEIKPIQKKRSKRPMKSCTNLLRRNINQQISGESISICQPFRLALRNTKDKAEKIDEQNQIQPEIQFVRHSTILNEESPKPNLKLNIDKLNLSKTIAQPIVNTHLRDVQEFAHWNEAQGENESISPIIMLTDGKPSINKDKTPELNQMMLMDAKMFETTKSPKKRMLSAGIKKSQTLDQKSKRSKSSKKQPQNLQNNIYLYQKDSARKSERSSNSFGIKKINSDIQDTFSQEKKSGRRSIQKKLSGQIFESDSIKGSRKVLKVQSRHSRNSMNLESDNQIKYDGDQTINLGTFNKCDGTILEQTIENKESEMAPSPINSINRKKRHQEKTILVQGYQKTINVLQKQEKQIEGGVTPHMPKRKTRVIVEEKFLSSKKIYFSPQIGREQTQILGSVQTSSPDLKIDLSGIEVQPKEIIILKSPKFQTKFGLIQLEKKPKSRPIQSGCKSKNGIQKGITLCTQRTNTASFCSKPSDANLVVPGIQILSPKISNPVTQTPLQDNHRKPCCERHQRYNQIKIPLQIDKAQQNTFRDDQDCETAKTRKKDNSCLHISRMPLDTTPRNANLDVQHIFGAIDNVPTLDNRDIRIDSPSEQDEANDPDEQDEPDDRLELLVND